MDNDKTEVCWSRDGESYTFDSLEELIHDARDDEPCKVGDVVHFGRPVRPLASHFISADDVLDFIGDRAYDFGGEHAEGFPDVSPEAKSELSAFLEQWLTTHCKPTFWSIEDTREYVIQAADLGASA